MSMEPPGTTMVASRSHGATTVASRSLRGAFAESPAIRQITTPPRYNDAGYWGRRAAGNGKCQRRYEMAILVVYEVQF